MTVDVTRTGIVITMAGAGSRFRKVGYTVPKYEIVARNRTLFAWSMESLRSFIDAGCPFYFIAREEDRPHDFIARESRNIGIRNAEVITVDHLTDGQATTAMLAESAWRDPADPVAIYNIDTYVEPEAMDIREIRGEGWIPCFPGEGDKWSFAAADSTGLVSELREKKRISPNATLGLYWFDSFARYTGAYHRYYANPERLEASERYIAPLYNQVIADGGRVYIHEVASERVYPLGTPEDVAAFDERVLQARIPAGVA
jgi:dTDP-glucose pyrophosphorylase